MAKKVSKKNTLKKVSKKNLSKKRPKKAETKKKVKKKSLTKKKTFKKLARKSQEKEPVLDLKKETLKRQMAATENKDLNYRDEAIIVDEFDEGEENMDDYFDDNYEDGEVSSDEEDDDKLDVIDEEE